MVATFETKLAARRAADLRRVAAQACIEWQAAHLAGCSPEVVAECEQQYLLLVRQAKMLEAR